MVSQERLFVINEPMTMRISPALAQEIGLNESIILLQMEYWLSISAHYHEGRRWTYQSLRDMQRKAFPFWSVSTIHRIIRSLVERGYLIEGNFNSRNGDKTVWYALGDKLNDLESVALKKVSQNETPPLSQNETGVSQNGTTIPQNKDSYKQDQLFNKRERASNKIDISSSCSASPSDAEPGKSKRKLNYTGEDLALAKLLARRIQENNPKATPPTDSQIRNWANTVRLMRERDGKTHQDIREVLEWSQRDHFWSANILSMDKLRKQWNRLTARMQADKRKKQPEPAREESGFAGVKWKDIIV